MAIIKPFKGIRPPKELVEQVASRPYDVLNSEEARDTLYAFDYFIAKSSLTWLTFVVSTVVE